MIYQLLRSLDNTLSFHTVSAHCDVPCGIYDTTPAQIAALSVLRFLNQVAELGDDIAQHPEKQAKLVRLVNEKEAHAEKVKHEIRVIWGDYFKGELLEKYPNIHELTHQIMMTGSASKQSLEVANGEKLVDLLNQFAEIFWESKGVATYRAICPYAPKVEVVYPKLA